MLCFGVVYDKHLWEKNLGTSEKTLTTQGQLSDISCWNEITDPMVKPKKLHIAPRWLIIISDDKNGAEKNI